MIGGVYCPLSPRDPQHRLYALIQQAESRLILIHPFTKIIFNDNIVSFDIDLIMTNNAVGSDVDTDQLSNVLITIHNIAYIIFTSGSTGTPKTVG